jgi:subtilase family serine protease
VLKQGTPINPQSSKTFSNLTILSSRLYEGVAFTITLDISREVKSNSLLGSKPYQYQVHTKSLDVSLSGEYYFSSAQLHSELHEDEQYQISFTLSNDTNEELLVTLPVTEVAELSDPLSSGESDLLFSARFSALQPVESNPIAEFSLSV